MRLSRFTSVLLVFTGLSLSASEAPTPTIGLELLPKGRPFRHTFADPREIRMALTFEGDARLDALIGNYFSIFSVEPADRTAAWTVHFGLEGAGFFTMRRADSRFPLETADGLIGLYVEGSSGDWQGQLRYTHVSAHLADGSTGTAIPYSRETLILRGAYVPDESLQVYAGLHNLVNTIPAFPKWAFQIGGSYFLPIGSHKITPFAALDVKWRQESSINPSAAAQLGFALNNPPDAYRSFRFFYSYFTGNDPRGQFYDRLITSHALGIEMQI